MSGQEGRGAEAFRSDLARVDRALRLADAVRTGPDGFQWVDPGKAGPDLMRVWAGLLSYGYANGLLP